MKICFLQLLKLIHTIKYQCPSRFFAINSYLYQNYYEVLHVSSKASTKEIKDAYIKLSKQYHPDLNRDDPKCHDKFVKIQNAYQTLINPSARSKYDNELNPIRNRFRSSSAGPYDGNPYTWSPKEKSRYGFGNNTYDSWAQYNDYIREKVRREGEFRRTRKAQEQYMNDLNRRTGEWIFWAFFMIFGMAFLHGWITSRVSLRYKAYGDRMPWMDIEQDRRFSLERGTRMNIEQDMMRHHEKYQADPNNMKVNEKD